MTQSHAANGKPARSAGDVLASFGWICFGICAVVFLPWYLSGLKASGVSGRVGILINPEAPQDQWRYEPAAHREVFILWTGQRTLWLMQSQGYCARTQVVHTDSQGRFSAAGWWESPGWPPPRIDFGTASPMVPGQMPLYLPAVPPADYTVILGPPPADSAMALIFTGDSAIKLAQQSGCPPPRNE